MKKCSYCQNRNHRPNFLYVVAAKDGGYPVKIGISWHVSQRVAKHRKKEGRSDLYVANRIEFCCEYVAGIAERKALDELRETYINVKGDWFDCPIETAIDATLRAQVAV